MTEAHSFFPAEPSDHYDALTEQLTPALRKILQSSGPGHRLRITTLPAPVMEQIAIALDDPRWKVRVLSERPIAPHQATAATIIRLRDHEEAPLLVFFPPGPRTASEDSLDIATFTELSLVSAAPALINSLLEDLDEPLQSGVRDVIKHINQTRQSRHLDEQVEYLLTIVKNGGTPASAGGAIYVFGLIPDFELFTRSNNSVLFWLTRNQQKCEKLAEINHPLQSRIRALQLKSDGFQQELFHFFRTRHTEDPRVWGKTLACDPVVRNLTFDRWEFADANEDGELFISLAPLSLPRQPVDDVVGTDRMLVLNLSGSEPLKVAFRSTPSPSQAPAWKHWRLQVLSVGDEGATVAWESNSFPKPSGGRLSKISRSIKVRDLEVLDEGTYFLRVDAYDAEGALLTTVRRIDPTDEASRAENESEPFLIVRDSGALEEPEVRATLCSSLFGAWLRGAIMALDSKPIGQVPSRAGLSGSWSQPVGTSVRGDVRFDLETSGFNGFSVAVPGLLRKVEATILESPRALGVYAMSFGEARTPGDVELTWKAASIEVKLDSLERFLQAREAVFSGIRGQHFRGEDGKEERAAKFGIVEVADLAPYGAAISAYAEAYGVLAAEVLNLEGEEHMDVVRSIGWLDSVELRWRAQPGDPGRAIILAPTHPLRLFWHLRHNCECEQAVARWERRSHQVPNWRRFLDQLQVGLLPLNLPMVLFDRRGRAYTEALPITSFWGLYLPDRDSRGHDVDSSAARDRVLSSLGIRARSAAVTAVDSNDIAARVFEFVVQHPYVDQLRLNVFNPGNGDLIADVLRRVEAMRQERLRPLSPLRYAVHLFASAGQLDHAGDAVEGLLDPDQHVGGDDEFTLYGGNHLHPKLLVARNDVADFVSNHAHFPAHISLLVEPFTARGRVGPVGRYRRSSFVGGLVQEPDTVVLEGLDGPVVNTSGWSKGIRPIARDSADAAEAMLVQTLGSMQRIQASIALGRTVDDRAAPVLALQLNSDAKGLIRQAHEVSDRVITIDRHLGVDYFDTPSGDESSEFLLDFAPEFVQEERQRIVVTTQHTEELEGVLAPMLKSYGIDLRPGDEVMVLEALKSLSGRLALRLEGSASRAKEVIGLLLARWLLEDIGALVGRIVIPVDAHQSWFQEGGPQRRADLLLVSLPRDGLVRIDVIEVKLRDDLPPAARGGLYRSMHEQTEATEARLRELFDPEMYSVPRADAGIRSKELAGVLSFYVRRALRYGLFTAAEADRALATIEQLDSGYRVELHSMGIVFERLGSGHHVDEDEAGFSVHRFGASKAHRLFQSAMGRHEDRASRRSESGATGRSILGGTMSCLAGEPSEEGSLRLLRDSLCIFSNAGREADEALGRTPDGQTSSQRQVLSPGCSAATGVSANEGEASESGSVGLPVVEVVAGLEAVDAGSFGRADAESSDGAVGDFDGPSSAGYPEDEGCLEPVANARLVADDLISPAPRPDVILGSAETTPQFGLLGRAGSQSVALDLNGCNTISLFGVQGFGKSYTLGVVSEMASASNPGINTLPSPLATVIFHYHKSDAYAPEYLSAVYPNGRPSEIERLRVEYGAVPKALSDVVLLVPDAKVERRRAEYPNVAVEPIKFSSAELGAESWKYLLGAYGNDSLYVRQLVSIMRRYRDGLTLDTFRREINDADFPNAARRLAEDRLSLAQPYLDDARRLGDLLRPGRTVIVDLRDEWIEKDEALGLFVVMLRIFGSCRHQGRQFSKLVVFDEAHKYISESDLISHVVETIREMRHQATSVVIASQDPLSVPRAIIELTSILILHRMSSPQWLKHLRGAIGALEDVADSAINTLQPGDALIWAQRSSERRFTLRPQKVTVRPRFTHHGGSTRTAVED